MIFKSTETLRKEMVGKFYRNNKGQTVKVTNVIARGGGHQVQFNRGQDYDVIGGLVKFKKNYPYEVTA